MTQNTSRRRFLKAAAATGAVAGLNATVLAQGQNQGGNYILLGGATTGWQGYRLPGQATASGSTNPTLNLQPGTTYTLLWKNVDGQPHNFAIKNSQGDNMAVLQSVPVQPQEFQQLNQTQGGGNQTQVQLGNQTGGNQTQTGGNQTTTAAGDEIPKSPIISEQGAVQGVRFTATPEMDSYICLVHPNTMVGEIQVGGTGGGGGNNSSM